MASDGQNTPSLNSQRSFNAVKPNRRLIGLNFKALWRNVVMSLCELFGIDSCALFGIVEVL